MNFCPVPTPALKGLFSISLKIGCFSRSQNCGYSSNRKPFHYWVMDYFRTNEQYAAKPVDDKFMFKLSDFPNFNVSSPVKNLGVSSPGRKSDLELLTRINDNIDAEDLICLINALSYNPSIARDSSSFKKGLFKLEQHFLKKHLSIYHKIQILYYKSLLKIDKNTKRSLLSLTKNVDSKELCCIPVVDLSIYCISLFKGSVPLGDKNVLIHITELLKREIDNHLVDLSFQIAFDCFVKCLRHSKFYDDELFDCISINWSNSKHWFHDMTLKSRLHLTIFLCDSLYKDVELIKSLINKSVEDFNELIDLRKQIRVKDIDNLLWCASNYCDDGINKIIQHSRIPEYILKMFNVLEQDPSAIINILLWLWIAECNINEAVVKFVTKHNISFIKGTNNFKDFSKLNLLLSLIEIEAPDLLKFNVRKEQNNRLEPRMDHYLKMRPMMKVLLQWLGKHKDNYGLSDVQFAYQIPGLYVGGIKAYHSSGPVHIELLDEATCLRNSEGINGKMALKLRLLNKKNHNILKVQLNNTFLKGGLDCELHTQLVDKLSVPKH